jgi:Tol biopolymer transport system component/predicted Ser/Thr protein kinase
MSESSQRWRNLEELYQAALEREPSARAAFLREACADESLRREVESLLDARGAGNELLERPALRYAAQSLEPGAVIGQYRIEQRIGAGGMGEVYRASDTRLHRAVALKVLPAVYAQDPAWLARFEREARVLASLNHPHIAAIYGVEERALVMELVEGPTLAERLARGRMPLEEVLEVAKQMAEALEYAHEKGVIHRDLKPANIKTTPDGAVKVLDFGLAKAVMPGEDTPTVTATRVGMVLGTPGYMAPEQASGMPVDKRADIWAFGVVLSEMVAGREVPAAIRRLLNRCLEKDPKLRLRDIGEARIAIHEAQSGKTEEPPAQAGKFARPWIAATMVLAISLIAGLAVWGWSAGWFHARPVAPRAVMLPFVLPEGTSPPINYTFPNLVPSPDGRYLAFVALSNGTPYLWVQPLDSATAQRFDRTEEASLPFWSPDGKSIGFFAADRLKRVSIGGDPQTVFNAEGPGSGGGGGTWNAGGTIVFPRRFGGLLRVSTAGGSPALVTKLDASRGEDWHIFPQFLPDGKHVLFWAHGDARSNGMYMQELGSDRRTPILMTDTPAVYASGQLLFVRQGTLVAQPFDVKRLHLQGEPIPLPVSVNAGVGPGSGLASAAFSVSKNGVLAYRSDKPAAARWQMVWYSRAGKRLGTVGDPADYSNPDLSPDGNRLAVGIRDPVTDQRKIWIFDLARGTRSRLTFGAGDDLNPVWSADGARIAFSSDRRGVRDLYVTSASTSAAEELLYASTDYRKCVEDWSPDGRWIVYNTTTEGLWTFSFETRKVQPYVNVFNEDRGRFSPDGKWVAYVSRESGREEVYIQPFPATGGKWQISTEGGAEPQWRGDGTELFFASSPQREAKIMAVDIAVKNGAIESGPPRALFSVDFGVQRLPGHRWAVARDGQKFLAVIAQEQEPTVTRYGVIYNWPALLEKR